MKLIIPRLNKPLRAEAAHGAAYAAVTGVPGQVSLADAADVVQRRLAIITNRVPASVMPVPAYGTVG